MNASFYPVTLGNVSTSMEAALQWRGDCGSCPPSSDSGESQDQQESEQHHLFQSSNMNPIEAATTGFQAEFVRQRPDLWGPLRAVASLGPLAIWPEMDQLHQANHRPLLDLSSWMHSAGLLNRVRVRLSAALLRCEPEQAFATGPTNPKPTSGRSIVFLNVPA